MKRLELEKQLEEAVFKVAKQGEPMDPEMLNPARKRPLPKVHWNESFNCVYEWPYVYNVCIHPLQLTEDEREQEFLLVKEWSRYTMKKHIQAS